MGDGHAHTGSSTEAGQKQAGQRWPPAIVHAHVSQEDRPSCYVQALEDVGGRVGMESHLLGDSGSCEEEKGRGLESGQCRSSASSGLGHE